jgi:uncharacterized protein (TIGR03437 family)
MKFNLVLPLRSALTAVSGFAMTLVSFTMTCPLQGQTITYFRQFNTPDIDRALAVTVDPSGIYVLGYRPNPQAGTGSAGVRKYDFDGHDLWTRAFTLPGNANVLLRRAATDASGVYVLGQTGPDGKLVLRKYSAGGDELWTRQLEFSGPGDIAVDATGVYVAGRDFPPNATYLRKYDRDASELWTIQFGDRFNSYNPSALSADSTGVYMAGVAGIFSSTPSMQFNFVRKWDSRGSPLWTRELEPPGGAFVFGAANPTGFYVAGNGFLRRYDGGGEPLWARQLDDSVYGISADASGVYAVGTTVCSSHGCVLSPQALPGQCASGSGGDSFIRRYDPDGVELWTREFGTADATWASDLAVDVSGVYVIGQAGNSQVVTGWEFPPNVLAQTNPTSSAFLAKFEKSSTLVTGSAPRIFPDCVVNAASYVGGGVAPGEIVIIFGSGIGPPQLVPFILTSTGSLATKLAGVRLLFNGIPAPLLYVSAKQSSAIVPYGLAGQTSVDVQVEYNDARSEAVTVPVLASRPGIFSVDSSGRGQGLIVNEDGSFNSRSNPTRKGSVITVYGTGGGEAAPGIVDGQILSGTAPTTDLPVSVWFDLDGYSVPKKGEVLYAGGVSGAIAGLLQINVRVPPDAEPGDALTFLLIIGSHWESQVTIALR